MNTVGLSEQHSHKVPPHVAILLGTYNGARFLQEQLDSIQAQSYPHWKLWVSDDGSSDDTLKILSEYRQTWGTDRLEVIQGPGKGFASNFLTLACKPTIQADYFAYADQDDIWEADKLSHSLQQLNPWHNQPALYCSRTRLINEAGKTLGLSSLFTKPPDFRNALVQTVGGGNTMVFNVAARQLLMLAGPDLDIIAHDWWTYIVISAAGGKVLYDPKPSLSYRQHSDNLMGSNLGLRAHRVRIYQLMQGHLKRAIDANAVGILRILHHLPASNRRIFLEFNTTRQQGIVRRLLGLKRSGIYRQTWADNLALFVAAFFKKL